MRKGCNLLFHRKLREELEAKRVTYIHHKVMAVTTDVEALYEAEEALVRGHWDDTRRLNMIPGGRAGSRYLRRAGLQIGRASCREGGGQCVWISGGAVSLKKQNNT